MRKNNVIGASLPLKVTKFAENMVQLVVSERKLSEIFEELAGKDPFFSELEMRVKINSVWKKMVGDFLASETYVSIGKDKTLEVWTKNSVVLSEVRFRSPQFLESLNKRGIDLKKIKVRRSR